MPAAVEKLTRGDPRFPAALRELHDAPDALYARGNLGLLKLPAVAIVGTRTHSEHGGHAAHQFAGAFARAGLAVVSGLAFGIDAAAHEGALDARGATIAVLGSGVDDASLFPRGHLGLARRLLAGNGLIVSENPPGTKPAKWDFPKRNRIIAALSRATVVVEAPEKSGALITAKFALELGRDLYAVPADALRESARGSNRLIAFGAPPLIDPEELIRTFTDAPVFDGKAARPHNQDEAAILGALTAGPRHIDEVTELAKLPAHTVLATLSALELRGAVHALGNMRWTLKR
jgi:DNA processing protein